jgi:hypothetical protein
MSDENEVTAQAFWEGIHSRPTIIGPRPGVIQTTPSPAEPPAEPAAPSAEDINALSLDDYAGQREALGIRQKANSDFIGVDDDQASGLPDWRTPVVEQVEFTEMDEYAAQRKELGIKKEASDFFGVAPRQARSNSSPWSL